jgi:hypothetical protein
LSEEKICPHANVAPDQKTARNCGLTESSSLTGIEVGSKIWAMLCFPKQYQGDFERGCPHYRDAHHD